MGETEENRGQLQKILGEAKRVCKANWGENAEIVAFLRKKV